MTRDRHQDVAERFYRRVLRLYPQTDRDVRGEEILGVLLEDPDSGSRRHRWREARSLVRHALGRRLAVASGRHSTSPRGWVGFALTLLLGIVGLQAALGTGWTAAQMRAGGVIGPVLTTDVVDGRWPVHVLWMCAAVVAVAGRMRAARVLTCSAAVLLTACVVVLTFGRPWPFTAGLAGGVGLTPGLTAATLGWWVLALGAAISSVAHPESGPPRAIRLSAAGVAVTSVGVVVLAALAAGPTALLGPRSSPVPLLVTATLLLIVVGRQRWASAIALGAWLIVPVVLHLPQDVAVPTLAVLAGLGLGLLTAHRRGSRVASLVTTAVSAPEKSGA